VITISIFFMNSRIVSKKHKKNVEHKDKFLKNEVQIVCTFSNLINNDYVLPDELLDWEIRYQVKYSVDPKKIRSIFKHTMLYQKISNEQLSAYFYRYSRCLFDSVSSNYFSIGKIFFPTLTNVEVGSGLFFDTLQTQNEIDIECLYSGGRCDVTLLAAQTIDWTKVVAREKINGTRLVRVIRGSQHYFMGPGIKVAVPNSFPINLIEYYEGKLYVLEPFGFPTTIIDEVEYTSHPWSPCTKELINKSHEGVMLLINGKEFRVKRHPTVEVDTSIYPIKQGVSGVWEVSLDGDNVKFIRPRLGKPAIITDTVVIKTLRALLTLDCIPINVTGLITVVLVSNGDYTEPYRATNYSVHIDSGYRNRDGKLVKVVSPEIGVGEWCKRIEVVTDVYHHIAHNGEIISAGVPGVTSRAIATSKIYISYKDSFIIVKEGSKSYDLPGGQIKPGESSFVALEREIVEELSIQLDNPKFIGMIDTILPDGTIKFTYLYIAIIHYMPTRGKLWSNQEICVPWIDNYLKYIRTCMGDNTVLDFYGTCKSKSSVRVLMYPKKHKSLQVEPIRESPIIKSLMTSVLVYTKLDIQSVLDLCPNAFKNNVQAFRVDKGVRIQCISTKKAIRLKSFFDGALFSAVLCPNSMPTIDGRPWMLDKFKDKGQLFIKDLTREGI